MESLLPGKDTGSAAGTVFRIESAATYSISGAVVGEWLGSQKGLGYYLLRVKNSYMLDKVFACVVVIILLSLAMNGLIRVIAMVSMPYERNKRS